MKWLLWLYPAAWRRRYGDEFLALIEDTGLTWRTLLDCVWAALEARIDPALTPSAEEPAVPVVAARGSAPPPEAEAPRPLAPRRPFSSLRPDGFETAIDQILRTAAADGAFDNLAGEGKPLDLDENPFEGEWATAFRMLRGAGETLPWIMLAREIDADEARLAAELEITAGQLRALAARDPAAFLLDRETARRRYLEGAAQLDRKLVEYGALVPHHHFERGRLTPSRAGARFDAACPLPTTA